MKIAHFTDTNRDPSKNGNHTSPVRTPMNYYNIALAEASSPQQLRRYCPNFPTFPSILLPLVLPSPSLHSLHAAKWPLEPARGSGERCKLPQWGLGRSHSRHRFWCILRGEKTHLTALIVWLLYTEIC